MNLKQKLSIFILIIFIAMAVFGILSIPPTHHHELGCPFMIGEQSICPMGLFEHISAWQSIFTVSISYIFSLIIILFFIFTTHPPNLLEFTAKRWVRNNFFFTFLYQELYSEGILNPKAP